MSGLLDVGTTKARAAEPGLTTDEDWVLMGCALVMGLAERFPEWVPLVPLLQVLGQGTLTGEPVPVSEVREGWRGHEQNTDERVAQLMPDDADFYRARGQARLTMLFYLFDDTGIWTTDDDAITLTDFGRDVARIFFAALDAGDLTL